MLFVRSICKNLPLIMLLLLPALAHAQNKDSSQRRPDRTPIPRALPEASRQINEEEDPSEDKIFTKCEVVPVYYNNDSLSAYFTRYFTGKPIPQQARPVFRLIITKKGKVREASASDYDVRIAHTPADKTFLDEVEKALMAMPSQWKPGMQNGRVVQAYINIQIYIDNQEVKAMHVGQR